MSGSDMTTQEIAQVYYDMGMQYGMALIAKQSVEIALRAPRFPERSRARAEQALQEATANLEMIAAMRGLTDELLEITVVQKSMNVDMDSVDHEIEQIRRGEEPKQSNEWSWELT